MNAERWQRVKEILGEALELSPDARNAFIDRAAGDDSDLAREVHSLVVAAEEESGHDVARFAPISERALQSILAAALGQQYEILRPLGRGGMGAVYLARERALERFVAIKVLRPEIASSPEGLERFRREARIAAQLSHPAILPLHTFGEVNGIWYFVMGYVRGVALSERLRIEGRLSSDETQRILIQLADALECAHRQGIVHRDIKPANILIDESTGQAVLADFGISKVSDAVDTLTKPGAVIGSPHFMSPEQAVGSPAIDARSDIYSLGAVAYTMLTGREPFASVPPSDVVLKRLSEDPAPIQILAPQTPRTLTRVVERAMARDPEARFRDARSLRDAVRRSAGDLLALPDALRDLPTFGPYALIWAATWTIIAWRGDRGLDDRVLLMLIAVVVPFGLLSHIWNVGRTDLGWSGIARVAFWPPDWWGMWWPQSLRRPADLWARLPIVPRLVRIIVSFFIVALPTLILLRRQIEDSGATSQLVGFLEALLVVVVALALVGGLAWAYALRLSWSNTARVLIGATTSSAAWTDGPLAAVLMPASANDGPVADTAAGYRRAISEALARAGHADGAAVEAAKRLEQECVALDLELSVLERDASNAELTRLTERLSSLSAETASTASHAALLDLVRRELDLVRELRVAAELVTNRRTLVRASLRGLWTHVRMALEAGDSQERIEQRAREILKELADQRGDDSSRLSHARAVAHSRLSVAGEISSASAASSMPSPPK